MQLFSPFERVVMRRLFTCIAVTLPIACGSRATEYTGTFMNERAPDSASTLAITLVAISDTSLYGVVRRGFPANDTVFALVTRVTDGLQMMSASPNGDTTIWRSHGVDTAMGGKYETIDKARSGSEGSGAQPSCTVVR